MHRGLLVWLFGGEQGAPRSMGVRLLPAVAVLALALPSPASARGFVSVHFGIPLVVGPPVYYVPPPIYYAPPPVYYVPPPPPPQVCHEYQTTATINGKPSPIVGTACLQPDGSWRVPR